MNQRIVIEKSEKFVRSKLSGESSGHDWWHVHRVRENALNIANAEGGVNLFLVEMAALLHDIADSKMHGGDHTVGAKVAREFLSQFDLNPDDVNHLCQIIEDQSFSAKKGPMPTKEGQIVQDADRLEALGAIGIARCFAYGGKKDRLIYDPESVDGMHSIQHFYDKLLTLKTLMNTDTGKRMAEDRHSFMEAYLDQFFREWGDEKA